MISADQILNNRKWQNSLYKDPKKQSSTKSTLNKMTLIYNANKTYYLKITWNSQGEKIGKFLNISFKEAKEKQKPSLSQVHDLSVLID